MTDPKPIEETEAQRKMLDEMMDNIRADDKRDKEREEQGLPPFSPDEEWYIWEFVKSGDVLIDFNGHLGEGIGPVKATDTQWADDLGEHGWLHHVLFDMIGANWHKLTMASFYANHYAKTPERKQRYNDIHAAVTLWTLNKQSKIPYIVHPKRMYTKCGECNKSYSITFDGKLFKFHSNGNQPCENAGGIQDWNAGRVEIPSGVMVVANDFTSLAFKQMPDRYVNDKIEMFNTANDYAEVGILHSFVGNSCPGIYVDDDGVITVANEPWDEDDDDIDKHISLGIGEEKARVCTDLWWWSGMDKDLYLERMTRRFDEDTETEWTPEKRASFLERDVEGEVHVEPGVYEMILPGNCHVNGKDYEGGEIYAKLRRVGDCK